tara:strand:- start:84012 stop:85433 length:1422 start_codon:yes stop_codon:yes gene_type:complete
LRSVAKYLLLAFILTGAFSQRVHSQSIIELLRFERAIRTEVQGEAVQKLYNARLKTKDATLVCDSAYQYVNRDELRAFGNIQIDTESENIWADSLVYYTRNELSKLRGRVIIKQDSSTLFGNVVDYNFATKIAYFRDGIRLEDKDGTLRAENGTYFQEQDSAIFKNNVQIQDSAQYAEGDSLFINRSKEHFQLHSRVFVTDSSGTNLITGNYLEADSTGRRFLSGNGYLRRIEGDSLSADTTHIHAARILMLESDSTSQIEAYEQVNVWSENFASLSDTLFYDSSTELFRLRGTPKAWHKRIQLNGRDINVQLDSSDVEKLTAFPAAFAVQEDSVTGRFNQLKGDTLIAYFDSGAVSLILLRPNSKILYHTTDDAGEPDGAIENASPETRLFFEDGDLIQAKMGQNQGLFLPEHAALPDRRLDGFAWDPDLRPQKPVTTPQPRFSPVPETPPFLLPDRYLKFIESQIADDKKN